MPNHVLASLKTVMKLNYAKANLRRMSGTEASLLRMKIVCLSTCCEISFIADLLHIGSYKNWFVPIRGKDTFCHPMPNFIMTKFQNMYFSNFNRWPLHNLINYFISAKAI